MSTPASPFYGVTCKGKDKWRAKCLYTELGHFTTQEEAAKAVDKALRKEHVRTGKPITKLNFPTVEERALLGRVGTINRSSGVVHATHSPAKSGGLPRVEDHDKDDSSDDDDEGFVTTKLKFTTSSSSHSVDEHGQDDSDSDWAEDYDEDEVLKGFDYAAYWAIFQATLLSPPDDPADDGDSSADEQPPAKSSATKKSKAVKYHGIGVTRGGQYVARVKVKDKLLYGGTYRNQKAAARAADGIVRRGLREVGRPVRWLNFPSSREKKVLKKWGKITKVSDLGGDSEDEDEEEDEDGSGSSSSASEADTPRARSGKASQYFGVSFNKPTQKWYSLLTINGRNRFGGSFFTEKDAARRTDRLSRWALREHDRPIRKLNFPTEAEAEILSREGTITQPLKQGGGEEDVLDEEERTAGGKGGDEDGGGKEAETRTSRYVGVTWYKPRQKWRSSVKVNGRVTVGGVFASEEDAARRADELRLELLRKSGRPIKRLNFPTEEQRQMLEKYGKITSGPPPPPRSQKPKKQKAGGGGGSHDAGSKDIESRDDDEGDDEGGRDKSQTPVQEKRRRKRGKTSEYHGVYARKNRWSTSILYQKRTYYGGTHDTELAAAHAFDRLARKCLRLHGRPIRKGRLNFPTEKEKAELEKNGVIRKPLEGDDEAGGQEGPSPTSRGDGDSDESEWLGSDDEEGHGEQQPKAKKMQQQDKQKEKPFYSGIVGTGSSWRSHITIGKKRRYGGTFATREQAALSHDRLRRQALLQDGRPIKLLNFPTEWEKRQLRNFGKITRLEGSGGGGKQVVEEAEAEDEETESEEEEEEEEEEEAEEDDEGTADDEETEDEDDEETEDDEEKEGEDDDDDDEDDDDEDEDDDDEDEDDDDEGEVEEEDAGKGQEEEEEEEGQEVSEGDEMDVAEGGEEEEGEQEADGFLDDGDFLDDEEEVEEAEEAQEEEEGSSDDGSEDMEVDGEVGEAGGGGVKRQMAEEQPGSPTKMQRQMEQADVVQQRQ